jgi:hypothetical protein
VTAPEIAQEHIARSLMQAVLLIVFGNRFARISSCCPASPMKCIIV